jgi:hypothetical protein
MGDRPHRVFISYSHRDEAWKDRLVGHLRVLAPQGEIDVWHDRRIGAGEAWQTTIEEAIDRADTAILLISADFLTSEFIRTEEVSRILSLRASRGLRVIPLIVKPCAWTAIEWLRALQARPIDGRPLSAAEAHEVDSALAELALEVYASPEGPQEQLASTATPSGSSTLRALRTLGEAALPSVLIATAAVIAMSIKVRTPLQLDVVTRTASFIVAGAASSEQSGGDRSQPVEPPRGVQFLNSAAALSRLVVEQCDAVSFPPLQIGEPAADAPDPDPLTFRCDPRVPGSRVELRALGPGDPLAPEPLVEAVAASVPDAVGTLGRIVARPGDRVSLTLTDGSPPAIRIELSGNNPVDPVDFTIGKGVPFEIRSEFAEVEGAAFPVDAQGMGAARAVLPSSSTVRLATLQNRQGVNVVLQPAREADVEALFRPVDVSVERLSLFRRSDADNRFVSTALTGTLSFPTQGDGRSISIDDGDEIIIGGLGAFRLTRLWVDRASAGLGLRVQGEAGEVTLGGQDRRLTLFEETVPTTTAKLVALAIAGALQWLWLKRHALPFNRVIRLR